MRPRKHNVILPYPAMQVLAGELPRGSLVQSARDANAAGCQDCAETLAQISDLLTVCSEQDARDADIMFNVLIEVRTPRKRRRALAFGYVLEDRSCTTTA